MKIRPATGVAALFAASSLALLSPASGHGERGHGSHANAKPVYGEPGDPKKRSREIVVVMKEADGRMLFVPNVITVARGEQVRFRLSNEGVLDHEFLLGTAAEIEEHADMMKAMPDMAHDEPNGRRVATKASGDLVWRFTKAGEFKFACLIPGHFEAGMIGRISVTAK